MNKYICTNCIDKYADENLSAVYKTSDDLLNEWADGKPKSIPQCFLCGDLISGEMDTYLRVSKLVEAGFIPDPKTVEIENFDDSIFDDDLLE